ncbi:MAG TPA: SgcJ/EcaC family oxidoreductase [Iamia sp.]|nr:SgcJ/EcaC family oxidoreductase [Iamia sp.]
MITTAPDRTDDIAAIETLIGDVATGIEARDPDRCLARFAADARSVNALGRRAIGRDAIHAAHVAGFASGGIPATARFPVLDIAFVGTDVAIATTGADGAGPDEPVDLDALATVVTWTMVRPTDDGWWIAARQFTAVTP